MGAHFQIPAVSLNPAPSYTEPSTAFLASTDVVDWYHADVRTLAWYLAGGETDVVVIARRCFEWVRDEIRHSVDAGDAVVTCSASEVLLQRTGFCYAKSHLLAALLRANGLPAGFCYQRLSISGDGPPFCLHGFNAVMLPEHGWYRVDPRGNKPGVDAQFTPGTERLAFSPGIAGEANFPEIHADPLLEVVETLRQHATVAEVAANLPDVECDLARRDSRSMAAFRPVG